MNSTLKTDRIFEQLIEESMKLEREFRTALADCELLIQEQSGPLANQLSAKLNNKTSRSATPSCKSVALKH